VKAFFDTNVLIYAQSNDVKGRRAQQVLNAGGVVSAQVLNEFASVASRKLGYGWDQIGAALADVMEALDTCVDLTHRMNTVALQLCADHQVSFYDGLIIAAAQMAGCDILYTEDLQTGRRFGDLVIANPFVDP
jgi:predicted nucleic acid-binding protein